MDATLIRGLDFAGAGLAFALTTLALLFLLPLAPRLNLLDHPNGARKDHAHPTPVTGGIAIVQDGYVLGKLAYYFQLAFS
jgi:UDP-N-acetylmuramyl pentapeptide phosphotransferase/UDP-N-acetylglucosamine-1-phosphate transferase